MLTISKSGFKVLSTCALVTAIVTLSACGGHGQHSDGHGDGDGHHGEANDATGVPGIAADVDRTIEVIMNDGMRFVPESIDVKAGETIRLDLKNVGALKHEMVIGELSYLVEHSEQMKKFPGMEHDEPNMLLLDPSSNGELIWTFTKTGNVDFACLQPGHYDAGMKGMVAVK